MIVGVQLLALSNQPKQKNQACDEFSLYLIVVCLGQLFVLAES
jgi:hypothetical protein